MRRMFPVLVMLTVALAGAQTEPYRVTRTYQVGGQGRWDYVVPDTGATARRLSEHVCAVTALYIARYPT